MGYFDLAAWSQRYNGERWREVLEHTTEEESFRHGLHDATRTGRPFCDDATTRLYEQRLSRTLRPRPTGRPRKVNDALEAQQPFAFRAGE